MKNSTLNSLDEIYDIIKRPPEQESIRILSPYKQRIFTELHGLSGEADQDKLKEARPEQLKKVNWVMKTKLTSDDS
ncbi:MAG: hypothetical protein V3V72_13490 [Ignavibacteriaceae bacterium]